MHTRTGPIIFDLDGTLIDSGADIAASANAARVAAGLPPLPEPVAIGFVGDGVEMLMRRVLGHDLGEPDRPPRPVAEADLAAGLRRFRAHYRDHCLDRTVLYPGVADLLDALRGRTLLLATNKPRDFTDRILDGLSLASAFAAVVAGDEAPRRKPDPAHLAACLAGLDPVPDAAAATVVGDSPNDVHAARGLGARAIAVAWGLTPLAVLRESGPDALVDTAAALAAELGAAGHRG